MSHVINSHVNLDRYTLPPVLKSDMPHTKRSRTLSKKKPLCYEATCSSSQG